MSSRFHDNAGILPEPPGPGWLRVCPRCKRWFALEWVAERDDALLGEIDTYQCKHCDRQIEFATGLPPHCV